MTLQVITISGRTIKNEAQASPEYAVAAIDKINDLLALLPETEIDDAQKLRKNRQPVKDIKGVKMERVISGASTKQAMIARVGVRRCPV